MAIRIGKTYYSKEIPGEMRNHDLPARFDYTDGFIGIDQQKDGAIERVLLSRRQVKALIEFVADPVVHQVEPKRKR